MRSLLDLTSSLLALDEEEEEKSRSLLDLQGVTPAWQDSADWKAEALPAGRTGTGEAAHLDYPDQPWYQDLLENYVSEPALRFGSELAKMPGGLVRAAKWASRLDPMVRRLERARPSSETRRHERNLQSLESLGESIAPEDPEGIAQELAQGVAGALPQMATSVGAVALGGPVAGTATIGALVGQASEREALARGVDPDAALLKSVAEAAIGGGLEVVGAGAVRKVLGSGLDVADATLRRRLLGGVLGEGGTEAAQELVAAGLESATGKEFVEGEVAKRVGLAGATGGILGSVAGAVGRIRHMSPQERTEARELLKRELTVHRGLPEEYFDIMEAQNAAFGEKALTAGYLANDLNKATRKYLAENPGETPNALGERMYRWLTSPEGERPSVPAELEAHLVPMRNLQDDLSRAVLEEPEFLSEAQKEAFNDNIGKYLRRSYAIHDDPHHIERVKGSEEWSRARNFLADQLVEDGADATVAPTQADRMLEGMVERSRVDGDVVDPFESAFSPADMSRADLSILKHRKDIEEPLLKVLGEYTDPAVSFVKSVNRVTKTLTMRQMYRAIQEAGEGRDFFEPGNLDRPEGHSSPIFPGEGDRLAAVQTPEGPQTAMARGPKGPLAGMVTRPELRDAIHLAAEQATSSNLQIVNGLVKYGFTVLSPQAQARNFVSNTLSLVAGGNLFMPFSPWGIGGVREDVGGQRGRGVFKGTRRLASAIRATHNGLEITDYDKMSRNDRREIFLEAARYGVVGKNADLGDIKYYLGEFSQRAQDRGGTLGKLMQSRLAQAPQKLYQFGDDTFQLAAFWSETEKYRWAGMSESAAKAKAAAVVKDTLQNYDRQPNLVRRLKRQPFVGPFISFPVATYINVKNQAKHAALDLFKGENARVRALGANRATSLVAALSMPMATAAALNRLAADREDREDPTEEQHKAIQEFMPFYARNSRHGILSIEPGMAKVADLSFMDYFQALKKPVLAFLRSRGDENALAKSMTAALDPFISEEPLAGTMMDVWRNRDIYGSPVRNPVATPSDQAKDVLQHVIYMNMPGALRTGTRIYRGATGWTDARGLRYDLGTEALAVVGPRIMTLDFGRAVEGRGLWFKSAKGKATSLIQQGIVERKGKLTDEMMRGDARMAHHAIKDIYDGMLRGVEAAREMGVSDEDIRYYLGKEGAQLSTKPLFKGGPSELDLLLAGQESTWFADRWLNLKLDAVNDRRQKEMDRELKREERRQKTSTDDDRLQKIRDRWILLDLENLYQ